MSAPDELWITMPKFDGAELHAYRFGNLPNGQEAIRYVRAPTAPQGAEPVAWQLMSVDGTATDWIRFAKPDDADLRNFRPLYAATQGAEIARENALRELVLTVGNYMQAKLYGRVVDVEFNYMRQALSQARAALTPTDAETKHARPR